VFRELLGEHFVHVALIAAGVIGVVSGVVGTFVVLRGMSFAVHAVSELGFTGAAAALVVGVAPTLGLVVGSMLFAAVLAGLTLRGRDRDSATGSFLAFGLGVGVLLLSQYRGYATEATNLLFGSVVGVSDAQLHWLVVSAAAVLMGMAGLWRPLLFSSVDPLVAEARGVAVRVVSVLFLLALAVATSVAIQVVGVLLILTLMVTPAAAAQNLAHSPSGAVGLAVAFAVLSSVGGVLLSLRWPYPTSFFVSAISFCLFLVSRGLATREPHFSR
jgi:zinc/manganese transport system permease protein